MLLKDPGLISSVLDFLSKKLDKFDDKKNEEYYQKTKEILGIERIEGEDKMMFYNVKCKELEDKSLLQYINWENTRMSRQREELIDLSVKIANLNPTEDRERAMEEVINHFKSDLPSGVGLRDMITQIKEHYPWSSSKKIIMIYVSFVTCLLGIALFVLDLSTDVQFSLSLFNSSMSKSSGERRDFDSFLEENNFSFVKSDHNECFVAMNSVFKETHNINSPRLMNEDEDYVLTGGRIALWHCIQPFFATLIVFLSMNFCKRGKCSVPEGLEKLKERDWWYLNCFCCIPNLVYIGKQVPLPGFTHLYRFYLDVKYHYARSKPEFRTDIVRIEEEIREHEKLGEL